MRVPRSSALALILANLVPLAGVVWLDWRVFDVLLLYWAENVVIGAVNVLRMLSCRPRLGIIELAEDRSGLQFTDTQRATVSRFTAGFRYFLIPFFVIHYGMFCFGHYSAVISLFGDEFRIAGGSQSLFGVSLVEAWQSPLWIAVAAIAISHLLSFFTNFVGRGEYQRTNLMQLMRRPYGRIIVLHVSVIAGGFLVTVLGDPTWMLLVLIIMKSAIDLRMHERERTLFAEATVPN